jgi:L-ascorbate metabolism protein UlaG (beta-lactamase superfamily)
MKIRFYAHASFRLEADGLAVITDPYTPGPQNSGFDPIDEPADIVIMSSATDDFHSDPSHVRGDPTHMGDIGNPVPQEHLDVLRGKVDLLFALAGAHATIALDVLDAAIDAIGPRVVIPMHYYSPRGVLDIEPVDAFLARQPADSITRVGGPELELTPKSLPAEAHIYVLEQSR